MSGDDHTLQIGLCVGLMEGSRVAAENEQRNPSSQAQTTTWPLVVHSCLPVGALAWPFL